MPASALCFARAFAARPHRERSVRLLRLQKVVKRCEEVGGAILPDEGQVCYFVPEESTLSRALVAELAKYCEELKRILELNPGKIDSKRVREEICHRFP
jgi:hypothetical protein